MKKKVQKFSRVHTLGKKEQESLLRYLDTVKDDLTLGLDDSYFKIKVVSVDNSSIDVMLTYGFGCKRKTYPNIIWKSILRSKIASERVPYE